jgi:hypothetical protein
MPLGRINALVGDLRRRGPEVGFGEVQRSAIIGRSIAKNATESRESGAIVSQQVETAMVNFYARVSTIADSVARTQTQLDKQVEHAVDREEYLRRDREIQRALERMATKDELRDVNDTLRSIQESIAPRRR